MAPTDRMAASQREMATCTRSDAKAARTDPRHLSPIAKILTQASVSRVSAEAWNEASVSHEPWAWVSA